MFRRGRGRPLLGAAVIVGASRSAANRAVSKSEQQAAATQAQVDAQTNARLAEADARKRDDEEREKRMQAAIDEALERDRKQRQQEMEASNRYSGGSAAIQGNGYDDPNIQNYRQGEYDPNRQRATRQSMPLMPAAGGAPAGYYSGVDMPPAPSYEANPQVYGNDVDQKLAAAEKNNMEKRDVQSMGMFCEQCGAGSAADAKFCGKCGNKLRS